MLMNLITNGYADLLKNDVRLAAAYVKNCQQPLIRAPISRLVRKV
jgi:hypothetical protein